MSRLHTQGGPKSSEVQKLQRLLVTAQDEYRDSPMAGAITAALRTKSWPQATKAVSLGLGSLTAAHQSRRLKQLALFLAIVDEHSQISGVQMALYAQDPTFTKGDEAFLNGLGIKVLHTHDESTLGEAHDVIDEQTLVYSPFLTLQAYKALFGSCTVCYLIGDDFNALKLKWPKYTSEKADVELILRQRLSGHRRRVIDIGNYWSPDERPFPMAAYLLPRPRELAADPTS